MSILNLIFQNFLPSYFILPFTPYRYNRQYPDHPITFDDGILSLPAAIMRSYIEVPINFIVAAIKKQLQELATNSHTMDFIQT
jgi:hypothetical protein